MVNKVVEYSETIIRDRLKKYDSIEKANMYLKSNLQEPFEGIPETASATEILDIIRSIFVNQNSKAIFMFETMSGYTSRSQIKYLGIPIEIQDIYSQFESNCRIFLDESNCWDLYRKDILRGIAYHEWLKTSFHLSKEEIERGFYVKGDIEDYKNLPIDLQIKYPENGKTYYAYPNSISNGLLSKDSLKRYTALFKLKEQDKVKSILNGEYKTPITNGTVGKRSSEFEKESFDFSLYEELRSNVCTEKMKAADIWFIKNTISSNLVESLSLILNSNKNTDNYDRNLIWIICGCIPPSIRIYLLEALKPAYIYLRNVIKSNRDRDKIDAVYKALFNQLKCIITEINQIYLKAAQKINQILEHTNVSANALIYLDETLLNSLSYNDDLPFICDYESILHKNATGYKLENSPMNSKQTSKERNIKQRIAFYVISALQLRFSELPLLVDIAPDYHDMTISYMNSFPTRLGSIIYGSYYKDTKPLEPSSNPLDNIYTHVDKSSGLEVSVQRGDKIIKSTHKQK